MMPGPHAILGFFSSTWILAMEGKVRIESFSSSVPNPWHFGVDPGSDPDPRIHASD